MPHSRFFINTPLCQGEEVYLLDEEVHHLLHVMRKTHGEVVELVNGRNQLAKATVSSSEKKRVKLKIARVEQRDRELPQIILCQALPRFNKLEMIVEKGTELGMTALWLFAGERSEKKELNDNQLHRLHLISIAAMKQCGRLDLPTILLQPPLHLWKELPESHSTCTYYGETMPEAPPFLSVYQKNKGVIVAIGPESGFSEKEEEHLRSLGAKGVKLHPYTLRTETASLVALSLVTNASILNPHP